MEKDKRKTKSTRQKQQDHGYNAVIRQHDVSVRSLNGGKCAQKIWLKIDADIRTAGIPNQEKLKNCATQSSRASTKKKDEMAKGVFRRGKPIVLTGYDNKQFYYVYLYSYIYTRSGIRTHATNSAVEYWLRHQTHGHEDVGSILGEKC